MSDKTKAFAASAPRKARPSTVGVAASSSRARIPSSAVKLPNAVSRAKFNKNTTILGDADATMLRQEVSMPDFDAEHRRIAYGKFLRAMLEECIVDEKIEREETQMDLQMGQLADRFQKTMQHLDNTSRRLKDVSFVVEQKRLLDLKQNDCTKFYTVTEASNAEDILRNLSATEQASLDHLDTKNIDFGYNKDSGHKQLLDAVNEAIEGLEEIKKHSNLDVNKFKEYEASQRNLSELERDRFDLESLKSEFEAKFPKFSERLLKETSEKIVRMIQCEDDDD